MNASSKIIPNDKLGSFPSELKQAERNARLDARAQKSLKTVTDSLRATPEGQRNAALNSASHWAGRMVAADRLPKGLVLDDLWAAADSIGLDRAEFDATFKSGFEAGLTKPMPDDDFTYHESKRQAFMADPVEPKRESQFFSASEFVDTTPPEREWIVSELIPNKQVTMINADGGTGKSLLVSQLAVAAVTDTSWLGMKVNAKKVIYLSAEDDRDEIHRRTNDIIRENDLYFSNLDGLIIRSVAGESGLLAHEHPTLGLIESDLYHALDKKAAEQSADIIIIDTLADAFPGNENDRSKARLFISMLRKLTVKHECAVILVAHPSLTGMSSGSGTSGSTGWRNSVRSMLYLSRISENGHEDDPDLRVLTNKKNNYGRIGGEIMVRWTRGIFVPEEKPDRLDEAAYHAKSKKVFLKILDALAENGRSVNANAGPNYAPVVFYSHPQNEGITKKSLTTAMKALLNEGTIESVPNPSTKGSKIVRSK